MFKLVKEIVSKEGKVHFRRWRILETPWFAIYVHNILRSDEDKDPHNHPWIWFCSFVLCGGYIERYRKQNEFYYYSINTPGKLIFRTSDQYHQLELFCGKPAWTIVITGPRMKTEWGYLTSNGTVTHKFYRKLKHNPELEITRTSGKDLYDNGVGFVVSDLVDCKQTEGEL
jgi:hypothetical protein